MICLICRQTEVIDSFTSVELNRGEMRLTIKNVPARVCPSCGEAYVTEKVALRLLRDAEDIYKVGILQDEIEYEIT
jgi:YgiT-type zinc finger domain-containing protein